MWQFLASAKRGVGPRCAARVASGLIAVCSPLRGAAAEPTSAVAVVAPEPNIRASTSAPLYVHFQGPAECGDPEQLSRLARALLKDLADTAQVSVSAEVQRLPRHPGAPGPRYGLQLRLEGAVEGGRYLEAKTCEEALRAGAVVIALAIHPEVLAEDSPSATQQPGQSDVVAPGSSAASTSPAVSTQASVSVQQEDAVRAKPSVESSTSATAPGVAPSSWSGTFGASARGVVGLADQLRLGARAFAQVSRGIPSVRLSVYYDPTSRARRSNVGALLVTSYGASAELCVRVSRSSETIAASAESAGFTVDLCGGWMLTALQARAPDLQDSRTRRAWVSSGVLNVAGGLSLGQGWLLNADIGVGIPSTRPRFVVEHSTGQPVVLFQVQPGPLASFGVARSF